MADDPVPTGPATGVSVMYDTPPWKQDYEISQEHKRSTLVFE